MKMQERSRCEQVNGDRQAEETTYPLTMGASVGSDGLMSSGCAMSEAMLEGEVGRGEW